MLSFGLKCDIQSYSGTTVDFLGYFEPILAKQICTKEIMLCHILLTAEYTGLSEIG